MDTAVSYDPTDSRVSATTEYFSAYAMPNTRELKGKSLLPLGVLLTPAAVLQPPPPLLRREALRCALCKSYVAKYSEVVNGVQWKCVFCESLNEAKGAIDLASPDTCPELMRRVVEYMDTSHSPQLLRVPYVFVIDAQTPRSYFHALRETLGTLLRDLPNEAMVGLVTFSNAVSVYDLSKGHMAACNVVSGHKPPTAEDLEYLFEDGVGLHPVREAAGALLACLEAMEHGAAVDTDSEDKLMHPRCVGAAAEVALALANGVSLAAVSRAPVSMSGGHIVVCTTGPPDFGPGAGGASVSTGAREEHTTERDAEAREYFSKLGKLAQDSVCTFDVFCAGPAGFSVPTMRPLVKPNGGSVLIVPDFGEIFSHDLWNCLYRAAGFHGTLEIRTSSKTAISRVIGGVTDLLESTSQETERSTATSLSFQLAAVHPDECFSLYVALEDDIPEEFVYFQFVLSFTDQQRNRITRVITRRLRTTGNLDTYLSSVDVNAVATLMAKRSVLMATRLPVEDVYADLDEQLRELGAAHGKRTAYAQDPAHRQRDLYYYQLRPELGSLPLLLYLTRRGPLLGPILQHEDDIESLRQLFLHAGLADSLRIMAPKLLSFDSNGEFEELPLETLAMQSTRILMLDHHTHVFIWSGRHIAHPDYDVYREACVDRARQNCKRRLPCPQIMQFEEHSSQERWLQCRLIPTHKDAPREQAESFPSLDAYTPEMRRELLGKFVHTDDPSFREYWRGLWSGGQ